MSSSAAPRTRTPILVLTSFEKRKQFALALASTRPKNHAHELVRRDSLSFQLSVTFLRDSTQFDGGRAPVQWSAPRPIYLWILLSGSNRPRELLVSYLITKTKSNIPKLTTTYQGALHALSKRLDSSDLQWRSPFIQLTTPSLWSGQNGMLISRAHHD